MSRNMQTLLHGTRIARQQSFISLNEQLLWQQLHDDHQRRSPAHDQREQAPKELLQNQRQAHRALPHPAPRPLAQHPPAATPPLAAHAQALTPVQQAQQAHASGLLVRLVHVQPVLVLLAEKLLQERAQLPDVQRPDGTQAHHVAHLLGAAAYQVAAHHHAQLHQHAAHRHAVAQAAAADRQAAWLRRAAQ